MRKLNQRSFLMSMRPLDAIVGKKYDKYISVRLKGKSQLTRNLESAKHLRHHPIELPLPER